MKVILAFLVLLMVCGAGVAAEKNYLDTEGLSLMAAKASMAAVRMAGFSARNPSW